MNYDATICNKQEKENLQFQKKLKEAIQWKDQKLKDLGHTDSKVVMIAQVSPEEVKNSRKTIYIGRLAARSCIYI